MAPLVSYLVTLNFALAQNRISFWRSPNSQVLVKLLLLRVACSVPCRSAIILTRNLVKSLNLLLATKIISCVYLSFLFCSFAIVIQLPTIVLKFEFYLEKLQFTLIDFIKLLDDSKRTMNGHFNPFPQTMAFFCVVGSNIIC